MNVRIQKIPSGWVEGPEKYILVIKVFHRGPYEPHSKSNLTNSFSREVRARIEVAPITQITHVHNKNSNIQGRSLNVIQL